MVEMLGLISAASSPYAQKARIALAEKDIPFQQITERPWDKTTVTARYILLEETTRHAL